MTRALDLIRRTKRLKGESYAFHLDIPAWRKFKPGITLNWQRVKFDPDSKASVPAVRGVYAFTLEMEDLGLPPHGYILYFGITGNKSKAHLRKRYAQYLREAKTGVGRPRAVYMLNEWPNDLFFNFMPIPDGSVDLAAIESSFLDSIIPPINVADFAADIGAAKKAAF